MHRPGSGPNTGHAPPRPWPPGRSPGRSKSTNHRRLGSVCFLPIAAATASVQPHRRNQMPRRRVAPIATWGIGTTGQTKRPLSEASSDGGITLREVDRFRSETGPPPGEAACAEKKWASAKPGTPPRSGRVWLPADGAASRPVRNRSTERGSLVTAEAANVRCRPREPRTWRDGSSGRWPAELAGSGDPMPPRLPTA